MTIWRDEPADPSLTTLSWGWHEHSLVVWEEPDELFPWVLSWQVDNPRDFGNPLFRHQETFQYVSHALIRAGVITYAVETDDRLVQPNLGNPVDRNAFDALVLKLLAFTTANRFSQALTHHVRR